jgi:hypothetical protein
MASAEREIEHTVEEDSSRDDTITTLSEREEHRVQMQEIKRRTVKPGLMKLNVAEVSSSENSHNWAIDIEHPVKRDTMRIFLDKPMNGWTREYKLVRMMDWYDIGTEDPHQLEFVDLYMEKDGERSEYAHDWVAVQPPEYDPPITTQIKEKISGVSDKRPVRSNMKMYFLLLLSSIVSCILVVHSFPLLCFIIATVLGILIFEPPLDQ